MQSKDQFSACTSAISSIGEKPEERMAGQIIMVNQVSKIFFLQVAKV